MGVSLPSFQELRQIPADLTAYSVIPHMHLLGREIKVTATLPDGTVKPLVWIKDWDFNWQATYLYREPLALPRGTKLDLVAVYDNSENNPRQTAHPPRVVRFGEQTTDEMCFAFFGLTTDAENLSAPKTASASTVEQVRLPSPHCARRIRILRSLTRLNSSISLHATCRASTRRR